MLNKAAGTLFCKGTIGSSKKWEPFFIIVADGTLQQYSTNNVPVIPSKDKKDKKASSDVAPKAPTSDRGVLLAIYPLTNGSLQSISKKEKTQTPYAFALGGLRTQGGKESKPWYTMFCGESQTVVDKYVAAIQAALYLSKKNIFGTTIRDACLKSNKQVPDVVTLSIECIQKNIKTEGLFRAPGDQELVTEAQDVFDRCELPRDLLISNVHVACTVLKNYFRLLAEPLIPCSSYNDFIQVATAPKKDQIALLTKCISSLPNENTTALHCLIKVAENKDSNKMDAKSLSLVWGSTIIRMEQVEQAAANKDLDTPSSATFHLMMEHVDSIFHSIDPSSYVTQINDPAVERARLCRRRFMTQNEMNLIESTLKPHMDSSSEELWAIASGWLTNVTRVSAKTTVTETRTILIDRHRVYFFLPGGKCEHEIHFHDIVELVSPNQYSLNFGWVSGKQTNIVTILPITFADFVIEAFCDKLFLEYAKNFVGRNFSGIKIQFEPQSRYDVLIEKTKVKDTVADCGGMTKTYVTFCDHAPLAISPNVLMDIEYFSKNNIRDIYLEDFLPPSFREKFTNPEFEVLTSCLRYNTWFRSLNCDNNNLTNDGMPFIGKILESNEALVGISLKNTGSKGAGLQSLFESLLANQKSALKELSLSGNAIDTLSACKLFSSCISGCLKNLVTLDINNVQMYKHGFQYLFTALNTSPSLYDTLTELDISNNRLEDKVATQFGTFLASTKALTTLVMSGVLISFGIVNNQMGSALCSTLTKIDVSKFKSKNLQIQSELIQFLAKLPHVTDLNLASTDLTAATIQRIWTRNIVTLDISDNDLGDSGIASFCDFLVNQKVAIDLVNLSMNRVFGIKKARAQALNSISTMLSVIPITCFQLKGSGKSALKGDALDLVLSLVNNTTLRSFDISGHQAGDRFANAVSKLLQHNIVLDSIIVDGNAVSIKGIKAYKLGLERNGNIKHFPLPLLDISRLLRSEEHATTVTALSLTKGPGAADVRAETVQTVREISMRLQKIARENAITFGQSAVVAVDVTENSELVAEPAWGRKTTRKDASGKRDPGTKRFATGVRAKKNATLSPTSLLPNRPDVMVPRASGYGTMRQSRVSNRLSFGLGGSTNTDSLSIESGIREGSDSEVTDSAPELAQPSPREKKKTQLKGVFESAESSNESFGTRGHSAKRTLSVTHLSDKKQTPKVKSHLPERTVLADIDFTETPTKKQEEVRYHVELHLLPQEPNKKQRHWNNEFQELLEQQHSVDKYVKIAQLISEWKRITSDLSIVIINELNTVFRTIEPVQRNEYHCQGIQFLLGIDFIQDDHYFYGNTSRQDGISMKSLSNHLKNARLFFDTCQNLPEQNLHLPLISRVHYKGYTVIASALTPLAVDHPNPAPVLDSVKQLCAWLNLSPWTYKDSRFATNGAIYGPELNLSTASDSKSYILHLSNLMPPEYPVISDNHLQKTPNPQSLLCNVLRPLLVAKYPVPLCNQAFTSRIQSDPKKDELNAAVKEASNHLVTHVIPSFASTQDKILVPPLRLRELLHSAGINVRHLGRVKNAMTSPAWTTALLQEICYRTFKNIIKTSLRSNKQTNVLTIVDLINFALDKPTHVTFKKAQPQGPTVTFEKSLFTVATAGQVVMSPPIPEVESFYFELTIKDLVQPLQISICDQSQSPADPLFSTPISEKVRIGVYIMRNPGLVQIFVDDTVVKAISIKDPTAPLQVTLTVGKSVTFHYNPGPFFEFPIIEYCRRSCYKQPGHQSHASEHFWSLPCDQEFQPGIKSFKNEVITHFPFGLSEEENSQKVDLRTKIIPHDMVGRLVAALGLVISDNFQNILKNKLSTPIKASDILAYKPAVDSLFSPFLDHVASAYPLLSPGDVGQVQNQLPSLELLSEHSTPLEDLLWCEFLLRLSRLEKGDKKTALLNKLLKRCKSSQNRYTGILLRESLILEGKILVEKESPDMSVQLSRVTAQSTPGAERKETFTRLRDLKTEILNGGLAQGKWLFDCAQSAFSTHGTYCLEYLVAKFAYTCLLNRTDKWHFETLEEPLLYKAISKLEKPEITIFFDAVLGSKYSSGVMFKALNFASQTPQGANLQKLFISYILEHNPLIFTDSPHLSASALKAEVLSQLTRSAAGSTVVTSKSARRVTTKPRVSTPESGSPSGSPRSTIHAGTAMATPSTLTHVPVDSRNSSPMKITPPKMVNPGGVHIPARCSFAGITLPLHSVRLSSFATDLLESTPQYWLILSDKKSPLFHLFHFQQEQSKWIQTKTFSNVQTKGHPDLVVFPPKAVALFVRGQDDTCLWSLTKNPVDSPWTQWESLGGTLNYDPVVQYLNPQQKYIFTRDGTKTRYKDISAPDWLLLENQSDYTIEGPLHKASWGTTVFLLANSAAGFVYTLFNGTSLSPWAPIELSSSVEPLCFCWGSALPSIAVIGATSQGAIVQRNFDTTLQQWDSWTTLTKPTSTVLHIEAIFWSNEEVTLILQTADGFWSAFGNGHAWNEWTSLRNE